MRCITGRVGRSRGGPVKVQVSRSRNACSHYVTKGFRNPETGRPTTKVVERLGNEEAIRARISGKLELG